ncbi:MAG TPA: DAK2 domain-containing protein [Candidatus Atopostipes pullistercoris]|uniref:DAK2 domain-containing protein n=1 Tax=Candidatus Atopostipes pullistercoris TaxID=2838467 RepID=A0A9D2G249_9LACT|nr:DAK2 domain-containing protein [Candidatus Atopostipes pullistercoris]
MELAKLTGKDFENMIAAGQAHLAQNAEYVNSLNVFPVPDGDTGTNMNLTFSSGAKAVKENPNTEIGKIGQTLSKGLLMGARGNSGVILSQLFRGFSKSIESKTEINTLEFAQAFQAGVDSAYKAIMKPVEGTILTVARESAEAGRNKAQTTDDIIEVMEEILAAAKVSLDHTPELLPVLKEVGVVDSGGQGLVYVYEGFLSSLTGEEIQVVEEPNLDELVRAEHHRGAVHDAMSAEDIKFGFCTEIMVRLGEGKTVDSEFDYDEFRNHLNEMGDSLLVIADDDIVKVHVHTERPGEVMNYGQKFGSLIRIKVDNMREQHAALEHVETPSSKKTTEKEMAVISVAAGSGVKDLFESMGVDYVIEGGQTMNPSTQDFLEAMEKVPAKNYILLPNNSNIFMAANQATEVSEANAVVVETKTIQQGINAMLAFNPEMALEEIKELMSEEIQYVTSGQITFAIRDTEINGLKIKKDDYMGIIDGDIKVANNDLETASLETIKKMLTEDSEIITLIYGEKSSEQLIQSLTDQLEEHYPDIEIETHEGGQPVYPLLISVE